MFQIAEHVRVTGGTRSCSARYTNVSRFSWQYVFLVYLGRLERFFGFLSFFNGILFLLHDFLWKICSSWYYYKVYSISQKHSFVILLKKYYYVSSWLTVIYMWIENFSWKKVAQSIAGIKKVRTFASAIENKTVAKQKKVLWKILDKQTECSTSVTHYINGWWKKKINRQFKNNFNGILNRAKRYPWPDI